MSGSDYNLGTVRPRLKCDEANLKLKTHREKLGLLLLNATVLKLDA